MTRVINKMKLPAGFLRKTFFGGDNILKEETIELRKRSKARTTAPFVTPGSTALIVGKEQRSIERITLPNIRIKCSVNPGDLWNDVGLEDLDYVRSTRGREYNAQLQAHIGERQVFLDHDIQNTEELMCSQMLQGGFTYNEVGKDAFTISTGRPATHSVTVVDTWDTPTAFPEAQFTLAKQLASEEASAAITDVLMSGDAALAFVANEGVQRRLDLERFSTGSLDLTKGYTNEGSVRYFGTFQGIRCWEYIRTLNTGSGVVDMIRPGWVEFISRTSTAQMTTHYAPITDDFDAIRGSGASMGSLVLRGGGARVKRFSKSWQSQDPTSIWVLMQSRPLPFIFEPGATVSMHVLP